MRKARGLAQASVYTDGVTCGAADLVYTTNEWPTGGCVAAGLSPSQGQQVWVKVACADGDSRESSSSDGVASYYLDSRCRTKYASRTLTEEMSALFGVSVAPGCTAGVGGSLLATCARGAVRYPPASGYDLFYWTYTGATPVPIVCPTALAPQTSVVYNLKRCATTGPSASAAYGCGVDPATGKDALGFNVYGDPACGGRPVFTATEDVGCHPDAGSATVCPVDPRSPRGERAHTRGGVLSGAQGTVGAPSTTSPLDPAAAGLLEKIKSRTSATPP